MTTTMVSTICSYRRTVISMSTPQLACTILQCNENDRCQDQLKWHRSKWAAMLSDAFITTQVHTTGSVSYISHTDLYPGSNGTTK